MEYTMNELVKLNSTSLWKHRIILPLCVIRLQRYLNCMQREDVI